MMRRGSVSSALTVAELVSLGRLSTIPCADASSTPKELKGILATSPTTAIALVETSTKGIRAVLDLNRILLLLHPTQSNPNPLPFLCASETTTVESISNSLATSYIKYAILRSSDEIFALRIADLICPLYSILDRGNPIMEYPISHWTEKLKSKPTILRSEEPIFPAILKGNLDGVSSIPVVREETPSDLLGVIDLILLADFEELSELQGPARNFISEEQPVVLRPDDTLKTTLDILLINYESRNFSDIWVVDSKSGTICQAPLHLILPDLLESLSFKR